MIEIEKRVLINKSKLNEIHNNILKEGTLKSELKRFTIVKVDNKNFIPNKDSLLDIKIRTTKDESLFTIKSGNWHSDSSRIENEIHINHDEITNLVSMLISLGYKYFVVMYVTRRKYTHKGLTITLDSYHHMDECLMEVEILADENSDKVLAENKINDFISSFNFSPMTSSETIGFITKINMIKETQIDFEKLDIKDWESKWKQFILCNI